MKKILLLIVALLLAAPAVHAAGGKMAFVDTQLVFDKTKLGKKYQGILKEYFDSRKKILDLDADEIQKLREDYGKQSAILKPEVKRKKRRPSAERLMILKRNEASSTTSWQRRTRSSPPSSIRR